MYCVLCQYVVFHNTHTKMKNKKETKRYVVNVSWSYDRPIRKRTEGNSSLEIPNKNHKTKGEEKTKQTIIKLKIDEQKKKKRRKTMQKREKVHCRMVE